MMYYFCNYRQIQQSFETIMASWDTSGDPCPAVNYEWAITRLDGNLTMDWLNMGSEYPEYACVVTINTV